MLTSASGLGGGETKEEKMEKILSQFIETNLEKKLCCILKKREVSEGRRFFANTINYAFKQVLKC